VKSEEQAVAPSLFYLLERNRNGLFLYSSLFTLHFSLFTLHFSLLFFPSQSANRSRCLPPAVGRPLPGALPNRRRRFAQQDRSRRPRREYAGQASLSSRLQSFSKRVCRFHSRRVSTGKLRGYGCFCLILAIMDFTSGGTARPFASSRGADCGSARPPASADAAWRARRFWKGIGRRPSSFR